MKVILNEAQREAVSFYFSPENKEGDGWPLDESVDISVRDGQLVVNECYLHSDGEWATHPESSALAS